MADYVDFYVDTHCMEGLPSFDYPLPGESFTDADDSDETSSIADEENIQAMEVFSSTPTAPGRILLQTDVRIPLPSHENEPLPLNSDLTTVGTDGSKLSTCAVFEHDQAAELFSDSVISSAHDASTSTGLGESELERDSDSGQSSNESTNSNA